MQESHNQTKFFLLGFYAASHFQILIFFVLLVLYALTVAGNILIIKLYVTSAQLRSPMYFFLSHLSLCDIIISTNVTPNALIMLLLDGSYMSFMECVMQFYFFGGSSIAECFLLTVMSYDRYLAICNPMHYMNIMSHRLSLMLVSVSWTVGLVVPYFTCYLLLKLDFCGPYTIDHFFCDLVPLLKLSCSETSFLQIETTIVAGLIGIFQFSFIVTTYVCIFHSIIKITSSSGRKKAFSTCSNHLCIVCVYYGTLNSLYVSPSKGFAFNLNKLLSLMNTVVTPLFNPLIYSLRNKEMRTAIQKIFLNEKMTHTVS